MDQTSSVQDIFKKQQAFFATGVTYDVPYRRAMLKKLRDAVEKNEKALLDALKTDLGKSETEGYLCEIAMLRAEISETLRGLKKWARPERHASGLACFPSTRTKVFKSPYGCALIISPFNFPVLLTLGVLIPCIAGGNTAILKVSSKSGATSGVLERIIGATFPPEYITVVKGGHDVADELLALPFDKLFYTGSPNVGKHVMAKASEHLTPVALELGGETGNWCVVRADADLRDAARKIAFFKLLNAGQICININQVAVAEEVAEEFIRCLCEEFTRQIGEDATKSEEYPHLITSAAYEKCAAEADEYRNRIVYGGFGDPTTRKYAPTVIYPVKIDEKIVQHELFSPLLPIVTYPDNEVGAVLDTISEREKGLAFYLFTRDRKWAEYVMSHGQYGGGCVNEVCYHMVVKGVPFNGTGHSGMGAYHGVWGFREFTHPTTVLYGKTRGNLPLREHPYGGKTGAKKRKLISMFFK